MTRLPSRRRDQIWLAVIVSLVVHVLLFLAISLFQRPPAPVVPPPMEITIAEDVGLTASSPNTTEDPAESKAPEIAPPADSAPPEPSPVKAEPAPPVVQPKTAPPPSPAAVAKPQPAKAAPAKQPAKTPAKPVVAPPAKPAPTPGKGSGRTSTLPVKTAGGNRLGDLVKGLTAEKSAGTAALPKATMTGKAKADIISAIQRQIQPCASLHRLPPTPGLDKVRVVLALSFARDGSMSAPPRFVRIDGLDDSNQRYADLMQRSAMASYTDKRCQPIKGLPAELYDVPGGWKSVTMGFRVPG